MSRVRFRSSFVMSFALAVCAGVALEAQPLDQVGTYVPPDADQKEQIVYLERQVYNLMRRIETYRGYLERSNLIDEQERSRIPLRSEVVSRYGSPEQKILTETSYLQWNGPRIEYVILEERTAQRGTTYLLRKFWFVREVNVQANAEPAPAEPAPFDGLMVNIVAGERKGSLYTYFYNYRFFSGRDSRELDQPADPGLPPGVPVDLPRGGEETQAIPVLDVREPRRRIEQLRRYVDALRLVERRVYWFVESQLQNEDNLLDK